MVLIVTVLGSPSCCNHRIPEQDHVIRDLTDQEDGYHRENHLYGLIPLKVTSLAKGPDNAAVTEAHDQEWQRKSQNNLACLDADAELVRAARVRGAGVVIDVGERHIWYGEDQCRHPNNR